MSESLVYLWAKERMRDLLKKTSALLIRSFIISDLSESLTVALFSWATRVICSQSLICPEKSERIAHSRSFDLSDEQISKFPTLVPSEFRKYIKLKKNFEKINFLKFKFFMYSQDHILPFHRLTFSVNFFERFYIVFRSLKCTLISTYF